MESGASPTVVGSARVVARIRSGVRRSRWLGAYLETLPSSPIIQESGRRVFFTLSCNSVSPCMNASGRGGQPGT